MANPGHPYRGIRNDSPGNVKTIPGDWLGQIGTDAAKHAIFSNPVYGARAMSYQLRKNVNSYGTNTLTKLIGGNSNYPGWAPEEDGNDVEGYVGYITTSLNGKGYNITGESDITSLMQDSQFRQDLMKAMTELEGDVDYGYFTEEILKAGDEAVDLNEQDINTTPSPSSTASQDPSNNTANPPPPGSSGTAGAAGGPPSGSGPSGGGDLGFKDPLRNYPREQYVGEQELNKSARAGSPEWESRIDLPKTAVGRDLLPKAFNPEYPSNKVNETSSGHRVEHDDTAGSPRIEYSHMNGSGFSIEGEPGNARMLVNSYGDMVELVGNDFTMIVNGNGNILYTGNLNLTVEGNMDLNVKKDLTFRVGGTYREFIEEQQITRIQGKNLRDGAPAKSEHIGGSSELLVLDSYLVDVSDDYEIIAGFIRQGSSGGAEIAAGSSGDYKISADKIQLSSNSFVSTSTSIDIGAASGQIGGNGVKGAFSLFGQYNPAAAVANKLTNSAEGLVEKVRVSATAVKDRVANALGANKSKNRAPDSFSGGGGS